MNYITVAVTCVIALMLGIVMLLENEMLVVSIKKKFGLLAILIIVEIIVDAILIATNGKGIISVNLSKIMKIVEFSVSPVVVGIFANIIARENIWKKIRKYFIILFSLNLLGQTITFFVPFMFSFDKNSLYSRTSYTYIYLVILMLCILLLVISTSNSIIQDTKKISCTIVLSAIYLIIGICIRVVCPETNSDWLCITFCYLIFIIYFCNNYLKIDSLTSLLNRRAFDNKLATINFSTAVIVIDANNFKKINDSYGHQSGDLALSKIAETIFNVYSRVGFCYRIGGDEFCIILRQGMLKKLTHETENCDTYLMLENLTKAMNEEMQSLSDKYPVLKDGVSQGYGIYFSKKDMPNIEKTITIEQAFKIADRRMYKNKSEFKHTEEDSIE